MKLKGVPAAMGQTDYEYQFFFTGTACETNAAGRTVGIPITDQKLLFGHARLGQVAAPSTLSIVYHLTSTGTNNSALFCAGSLSLVQPLF
jgi:hypothetical protein